MPFFQANWRVKPESKFEPLPKSRRSGIKPDPKDALKVLIFAFGRCKHAIRKYWASGDIQVSLYSFIQIFVHSIPNAKGQFLRKFETFLD